MKSHLLSDILKGKIVFLGVGNILRADDAFGPELIAKLQGFTEAVCIDAGTTPENYAGKIIKEEPDTVVIIDAAHLGLNPGDYDILNRDEIAKSGLTTHDLSPEMFIGFLEEQTRSDIYMLAVQPENVSFGGEMSVAVKEAIEKLTIVIKEAINA
ncbi:MAG: hydrogenase 3 maturation endopeptidase HyCI [Candidatus Omnitrophota bacterium]